MFAKYKNRGAGYHWDLVGPSPIKHNAFVSARFRSLENLLRNFDVRNKRVLDVGCGDGVLVHKLAKLGVEKSVGIDPSEEAIDFAKKMTQGGSLTEFYTGTAYALPFDNKCFDYITSSEVIEHLQDPKQMLNEMKRVWTGRGAIIITTPIRYTQQPSDPEHVQEFFTEDFISLMLECFGNATIIKTHPLFWNEFQQIRLLGKPFGKLLLNLLDILLHVNPFLSSKGWRFYAIQTAIIENPEDHDSPSV